MDKYCVKCGAVLEENAAFCGACGTKVEQTPAPQPVQEPAVQQPVTGDYSQQYGYQQPVQEPAVQQPVTGDYSQQYGYQQPVQQPAMQYAGAAQSYTDAQGYQPMEAPAKADPAKKKKIKLAIIISAISVVVIAAVVVVLVVFVFGKGGNAHKTPEDAFNRMLDCAKELDIKGAAEVSYEMNFSKDGDRESKIDEAQKQLDAYPEMVSMYKELMKNMKVEIKENEAVSDDKMKSLIEDWSFSYKDTDKITEIREIKYEISGNSMMNGSSSCYAVKVGDDWYIMGANIM